MKGFQVVSVIAPCFGAVDAAYAGAEQFKDENCTELLKIDVVGVTDKCQARFEGGFEKYTCLNATHGKSSFYSDNACSEASDKEPELFLLNSCVNYAKIFCSKDIGQVGESNMYSDENCTTLAGTHFFRLGCNDDVSDGQNISSKFSVSSKNLTHETHSKHGCEDNDASVSEVECDKCVPSTEGNFKSQKVSAPGCGAQFRAGKGKSSAYSSSFFGVALVLSMFLHRDS